MRKHAFLQRDSEAACDRALERALPFPRERRLHYRRRQAASDFRLKQPARRGGNRHADESRRGIDRLAIGLGISSGCIVARRQRRVRRGGIGAPDATAAGGKPADG